MTWSTRRGEHRAVLRRDRVHERSRRCRTSVICVGRQTGIGNPAALNGVPLTAYVIDGGHGVPTDRRVDPLHGASYVGDAPTRKGAGKYKSADTFLGGNTMKFAHTVRAMAVIGASALT